MLSGCLPKREQTTDHALSHNCTVPLLSHPASAELPPSSLPSKTSAPTPTLLVHPSPLFPSTSDSFSFLSSPQDASLLRLPGAYARHVQAGLQGSVPVLCLFVQLVLKDLSPLPEHGPIKLSTYLINYRIGDIVDIKANAAQQKGMPHKYYHG